MATELVELGGTRPPRTCRRIRKLRGGFAVEIVDAKGGKHRSWLGPGCARKSKPEAKATYATKRIAEASANVCAVPRTCNRK